ncbi:SSI family serine proteinase inhibitor [Streptomyces boncukensis]|uniref:Subtilisin inhibitor domain-containing protein n=1 Tax=Streptomyces boncukensis TaxID=2711219 RepID=A0A6G4WXF5_9ACTN|nr:SSI family serine proteinase inhibitor [Streptomyces boncukensis]NGO69310.1 hypothetical protein [Streptomyces boncukensis]
MTPTARPTRSKRTARAAAGLILALASAASAASAVPAAAVAPPPGERWQDDHLTVTVEGLADPSRDGTYELYCHPARGSHPEPKAACDGLDELVVWGKDPFAPVPPHTSCTMVYGGPATARVQGRWAGRPVDARYSREDGCEIDRWDRMIPLLPRG